MAGAGPLTPQGTVRLPLATLTQLLAQGRRIVGVSITPGSHEVVSVGPQSYQLAAVLNSGSCLTPEDLKALVDQQQAGALVLGGSALFRADGGTHFGVRKLISAVMGVTYHPGAPLPTPVHRHHQQHPQAGHLLFQYRPQQHQQHQQQAQRWGPGSSHQVQQRYHPQLLQPYHHAGGQHRPHPATPPMLLSYSAYQHQQQQQQQGVITPILLCRENEDDASAMLTRYIKRHSSAGLFPPMTWERWTSAS